MSNKRIEFKNIHDFDNTEDLLEVPPNNGLPQTSIKRHSSSRNP